MPFIDSLRRGGCRALALLTFGLVACAPPRAPAPAGPSTRPPSAAPLPPVSAARARDWDEYKLRAAQRLADANPGRVYLGPVPEPLLAVPVLEIELAADGSVRHIGVLRRPSNPEAADTVQLAIDAVRRAAPFGAVSHLPRPWKFTEVFLFADDRRFKPRLLDL